MHQKLQNYEMQKYLKLNLEVLEEESDNKIVDLIKEITDQLKKTIDEYKQLAKSRGIKVTQDPPPIRKRDTNIGSK